jgi:hypothetical protein
MSRIAAAAAGATSTAAVAGRTGACTAVSTCVPLTAGAGAAAAPGPAAGCTRSCLRSFRCCQRSGASALITTVRHGRASWCAVIVSAGYMRSNFACSYHTKCYDAVLPG